MRHFQLAHQFILLGELCIILCGAVDLSIGQDGSCSEDIELTVTYKGSGSVDIVSWKFSKMTDVTKTLNIITAVCQASPGADAAFPVGRMTYDCDNTNKIYKATISPFNSTSDTGNWEARVSISGSYTDFNSIIIECNSCKCECDCMCRTIVIVSMVFGIPGALGLLIVIVGLLTGCFDEKKTLLLVFDGIGIVSDVLSLILSIVVTVKECCEENCECCEEDSECCEDWIDNAAIAFIVIPCLAVVASVVIFILVKLDIIGPGRNGGNGFFCFNYGNDDGNDGGNDSGNNGHHRGRGTNSSTVHTERTDTHRGTLSDRANSDGEVSRKDVHVQENRDNFSGRPMPPIPPLTDKKGRGLSANYDDDHPMTSVGIPDKKAGQLVPLKEQEEQKKKEESKKRRKRKKKAMSDDDDDDDVV